MRIPPTPERIKEAPAQALRAVFASVGQVLLMTERIRRRAIGQEHSRPVSTGALATREAPAPVQDDAGQTAASGTDRAGQATASAVSTKVADSSAATTSKASTSRASTSAASTSTAPAGAAKSSTAKGGTAKAKTVKTGETKASSAKTSAAKTGPVKASAAKADTAKTTTPADTATPTETATPLGSAPPEVRGTGVLPVPHYSELSIASLRARLRGLDVAQVRDLLGYERSHEDRANVIAMFERRIAKLEAGEGADPAAG